MVPVTSNFWKRDLDWEYTQQQHIGLIFSFWKRKARMKVDVYQEKTTIL
jgi:hypothetical protein